jgi:hypothetical protein
MSRETRWRVGGQDSSLNLLKSDLEQPFENCYESQLDQHFTEKVYPKVRTITKRDHHPKTKTKS